jgi:Flp pilus assembly protein CpaB
MNPKNLGILLVLVAILVVVAVVIRQRASAPPEPTAPGYYEGPMKGKGSGGMMGGGQ